MSAIIGTALFILGAIAGAGMLLLAAVLYGAGEDDARRIAGNADEEWQRAMDEGRG